MVQPENKIPVAVFEVVTGGQWYDLSNVVIKAIQILDSLEGQLKEPPIACIKEISIPYNFPYAEELSFDKKVMISYHNGITIKILAFHNWVSIFPFGVQADMMTTQPDLSQADGFAEQPELPFKQPSPYIPIEGLDKPILSSSDCVCWGDHNGMAMNPECLLHGPNREAERQMIRNIQKDTQSLQFSRFSRVNLERCLVWHPEGIESWSLSDWTVAMLGEAGELANKVKKLNRIRDGLVGNKKGETELELTIDIAKEVADVVISCDLIAARIGVSLEDIIRDKFNEVSERNNLPQRL